MVGGCGVSTLLSLLRTNRILCKFVHADFISKFEIDVWSFFPPWYEGFLHYCSVISEPKRDAKKLILTKDLITSVDEDDELKNAIPRMKIPHRLFARPRVVLLD